MDQELPYLRKNSKWSSSKNYLPVLTFCNDRYLTLKKKRSISNVWTQASSNVKNFIQTKCNENKKEGKKTTLSNEVPTVPLYYYYPTYHRPKSYLSQLEIMSQMYKKKIKNVNAMKQTIAKEVSVRNAAVMRHIQMLKDLKNEQNNDQELFQKGLSVLYDSYQREKQLSKKLSHKNLGKSKTINTILKSDAKNDKPKYTKKRTIFTMTDAVRSSTESDISVKTDKIKQYKKSIYSDMSKKSSNTTRNESLKLLGSNKIRSEAINEENSLNLFPSTSFISHTEVQSFKSHYERPYFKNNEFYSKPLLLTSEKATKCTFEESSNSSISKRSRNTKITESTTNIEKNNRNDLFKKLISNEDKLLKTRKYTGEKNCELPSVANSISIEEVKILSPKTQKMPNIENSLPRIDLKKCQKWENSQSQKITFLNQITEVKSIIASTSEKSIFNSPEKIKKCKIKPEIVQKDNRSNFIRSITAKNKVGRYKFDNKYDSDTNDFNIPVKKQVTHKIINKMEKFIEPSKTILPILRSKLPSLPDIDAKPQKNDNKVKCVFPAITSERSLKNLNKMNAMKEQIEKELSRRVEMVCRTGFYPPLQKKSPTDIQNIEQIIPAPVLDCISSKPIFEISDTANVPLEMPEFPEKQLIREETQEEQDFDDYNSVVHEVNCEDKKSQFDIVLNTTVVDLFDERRTGSNTINMCEDIKSDIICNKTDIDPDMNQLTEINKMTNQYPEKEEISESESSCLSIIDDCHEISIAEGIIDKTDSISEKLQEIDDATSLGSDHDIKQEIDDVIIANEKHIITADAKSENYKLIEPFIRDLSHVISLKDIKNQSLSEESATENLQQTIRNVTTNQFVNSINETINDNLDETILEGFDNNDEDFSQDIDDQCATPDTDISEESNVEFGSIEGKDCIQFVEEIEEVNKHTNLGIDRNETAESAKNLKGNPEILEGANFSTYGTDEITEDIEKVEHTSVTFDYKDEVIDVFSQQETADISEGETVSFSSDDEIDCEQSIDTQTETVEAKQFAKNVVIIFKATTEFITETDKEAIEDPNLGCDYYNFDKVNIMAKEVESDDTIVNFYEVNCREQIKVHIDEIAPIDVCNETITASDYQDTENKQENEVVQVAPAEDLLISKENIIKVLTVDAETENPILDFDENDDNKTIEIFNQEIEYTTQTFCIDATTETEPINEQSQNLSINDITFKQSDMYKNGIMINLKIHLPSKLEQNVSKDTGNININVVPEIKSIIEAHLQTNEKNIIKDLIIPSSSVVTETGYELLETAVNNMIKDAHKYDHIFNKLTERPEEFSKVPIDNPVSEVVEFNDYVHENEEETGLSNRKEEDVRSKDFSEIAFDGVSMETGYKSQSAEIEQDRKVNQSNTISDEPGRIDYSEQEEIDDDDEIEKDSSIESLSKDVEDCDHYKDTGGSQEDEETAGSAETSIEDGSEIANNPECNNQEQLIAEQDDEEILSNEGPNINELDEKLHEKTNVNMDNNTEYEEEAKDIKNYDELTEPKEKEDENIKSSESACSVEYQHGAPFLKKKEDTADQSLQDIRSNTFSADDLTNECHIIQENVMISEQFVTEPIKTEFICTLEYDQVEEKGTVLKSSSNEEEEHNNAVDAESEGETQETILTMSRMLQSQIQDADCIQNPKVDCEDEVMENVNEYPEDAESKEICPQTNPIYNAVLKEFFSNISADDFPKVFPINTVYLNPNLNDKKVISEVTGIKPPLHDVILYDLFSNLPAEDFTKTFPVNEVYLKNPICDDQEIKKVTEYPEDIKSKEISPPVKTLYDVILREFYSNSAQETIKKELDNISGNTSIEEEEAPTHRNLLKAIEGLMKQDVEKAKEYHEDVKSKETCSPTKTLYDVILREFYSCQAQETTEQEKVDTMRDNIFASENTTIEEEAHQDVVVEKAKEYHENVKNKEIFPNKSIYDAILHEFYSNPVLSHEGTEEDSDGVRSRQSLSGQVISDTTKTLESEHNTSTDEETEVSTNSDQAIDKSEQIQYFLKDKGIAPAPEPKFILLPADKLKEVVKEYLQENMHVCSPAEAIHYEKHQTLDMLEKTAVEENEIVWEPIKSEDSSTSEEDTTPTTDRGCHKEALNRYEDMTKIFVFGRRENERRKKEENFELAPMKKRRIDSRAGPWGDTTLSVNNIPLVKNKTIQNIKLPPLNSSHTLPKIKPRSFSKYKRGKFFPTKVKLVEKVVKCSNSYKDETAIEEEKNVLCKILESEINTSLRMASCSMNAAANIKFVPTGYTKKI